MPAIVTRQSPEILAALALLRAEGYDPRPLPETRGGFMRVWIEPSLEVARALRERGAVGNDAARLLPELLAAVPLDGQRLRGTQQSLGILAGLDHARASRAFALLRELGVVLLPERRERSRSWEMAATYASRLNDARREAEIVRQRAAVAASRRAPHLRAVAGAGLRDLGVLSSGERRDVRAMPAAD